MVDRGLLASKLAELADRLQRVRGHCPESAEELSADRDAQDIVSFNLMLAVQTCTDIAAHVIADEGWPAARGCRAPNTTIACATCHRPESAFTDGNRFSVETPLR